MAASDHLNEHQFRMHHSPSLGFHWAPHPNPSYEGELHMVDDDPSMGHHMITASTGNNKPLGMLRWKDGVVQNVDVSENWQHKGMATQMWNRAKEITPNLRHSTNRTEAGNTWAKHVGGELPERVQDHPEWYE